jgi:ArsR family transcriptional regulator, arsenate/arsenite/antimonite-responsive transcriptional repressor
MNSLTSVFKLLSDDTRLRIIMLLYQEELCVCQLSGILKVPQPTVSKNLSKLRDLNLAVDQRKDKFVYYTLRSDNKVLASVLKSIHDQIEDYPQLIEDRSRLSEKDQYLSQCGNIATLIS